MEKGFKVISVNISEKKGTIKKPVEYIDLFERGVKNDAHSGLWHRQVSLLGLESFEKFSALAGREIAFGEFAENITTKGLTLYKTSPLDKFINENVILEVTQIGKKCHGDSCAIYREVGNCVMPKEGIFARVLKNGVVKEGDEFMYEPKVFKTKIITLSDRASIGEYEDRSGPRISELLESHFEKVNKKFQINRVVIADEETKLKEEINKAIFEKNDFIFTTGGTGVGARDITPDVVKLMLDKEIPGIMELIRTKYGQEKPNALLSRGIAGVIDKTQVYTLPGSVKAVNEYMKEILKTIDHLVLMLYGIDAH
ncbi:MAG TPA: molybdenum cofactor synthesis protein [Bacteroidales bacterium]|nr:MAG: molybdenum cofactor synthesis protein [Bacteroidetes bacterium GWF2_33_38]OFY75955.1 MAG: molybdenum cofactor synthesis protein [Bacteroidetes bacterium RIFOXYA12_FULL_33_9]OFY86264.1 MAG: molybdenum cofactor synthesis protein [Bacteroidetes bacterium RIFOXYA2_FULL_33_7]HBF88216.1 molybdenum cofactor synthesis protein [Bacteroidales bacterium]